jgi:hypothetical protein
MTIRQKSSKKKTKKVAGFKHAAGQTVKKDCQPGRIYKEAAQTRTGRQSSLAERTMPWQERYTNRQDVQAGTSPAKQPEHVQRLYTGKLNEQSDKQKGSMDVKALHIGGQDP